MERENFTIIGMSCTSCASGIEKRVAKMQGVQSVSVNFTTQKIDLLYDSSKIKIANIIDEIKSMGYEINLEKFDFDEDKINQEKKISSIWKKFVLSAVFALPLFIIAMIPMFPRLQDFIPYAINPTQNPLNYALTQLVLTMPIIFAGRKFYSIGFRAIFKRQPNMESLISIGTTAALVYSIYNTYQIFRGNLHFVHSLYFETVGVIITLILLGKYLETISKGKTSEAIKKLMGLSAKTAIVIRNAEELEVPIEQVEKGDILLVKPGAKIPVDGEIIFGSSTIDEAMLTGESLPVLKSIGDQVFATSINKTGMFKFRATKVGEETAFAQIIKLVEDAQTKKAPIARMADIVSSYFVPIVFLIALISSLIWYFTTKDLEFALNIFISVLVIACPCALGLATPTTIMVATGKAAEKKILIKSGEALETAHKIDSIIFDKTGTITEGKPKVADILIFDDFDRDKFISIVASLEKVSEHPLAEAIVNFAKENNSQFLDIENFESITGKGVEGEIDGLKILAGNLKLMQERGIELAQKNSEIDEILQKGKTPIYVAIQDKFMGAIFVSDSIKPTSADAISKIKKMGIEVFMITGDHHSTAKAIASQVGIENILAEVLPKDKADKVLALQKEGKKVAMVGDGINDAPALAQADIGIAIGSGTDIAIESADLVLVKNDLQDVCSAIKLSKKTIKNIKQSLFWAFFYNVLGIPIACGVLYIFGGPLLNPMFAALAMSLSSVSVLLNSLRVKNIV